MAEQRQDRTPRKNGRPPQPGNGGMRFGRGLFGWVLFIGLAVMLFFVLNSKQKSLQDIPLSDFLTQADNGNVANISIDQEVIKVTLRTAQQFSANTPPTT